MNDAPEARCPHCGTPFTPGYAFCSHCGANTEREMPEGDPLLARLRALFGSELEFEHELGRGGMAVVYAAFDPALERRVAVKSMLPDIAAEPDVVARFLREARTVAALQHPHVVSVFSVRSSDGVSAIVMQFVEGRSLDVILKERAPLPLPVAGQLLTQIAGALQHAHDRGVIHRDVKPANVLIDREGNAVVSDFGIARRDGNTRITGTGMMVGSMAYMSPEQRSGRPVGPASDQYAFGVMAFELLAGRRPFKGSIAQLHESHLSVKPPALRQFRPDLSPALESLVARMLQKDAAARHPNLREVERAFRDLIPDSRTTTMVIAGYVRPPVAQGSRVQEAVRAAETAPPVTRATAAPVHSGTEERVPTVALQAPPVPRRRQLTLMAAAVAVAVLGTFAFRFFASRQPVATSTTPSALTATAAAPTAPAAADVKANSSRAAEPATSGGAQRANIPRNDAARSAVSPRTGTRPSPRPAAASTLASLPASDSAAGRAATRPPTNPGSARSQPAPAATLPAVTADARAVAREFVTMLNQRRWHELDQLGALAGDAALRAQVVTLTHNAQEFGAGFERIASPPEPSGDAFLTECIVDLAWRGGHRLLLVHLRAVSANGTWHLAAFGMEPAD